MTIAKPAVYTNLPLTSKQQEMQNAEPRLDASGTREVPSSGGSPQRGDAVPSRPASPVIPPPAPSDIPVPPAHRAIYPQVNSPSGGYYGRPNRQMRPAMNTNRMRDENAPYVAVDPFIPSIMKGYRKNAFRPDITSSGSNSYHHHPSYPSNRYPEHHVSSQLPHSSYQPMVTGMNTYHSARPQWALAADPGVWASAPPRPNVVSEKSSSRSRSRSRGSEIDQAPLSEAEVNSESPDSPRRSRPSNTNGDNIICEPILRTPSVLSHADVDLEGDSGVSLERVRPPPSRNQMATAMDLAWGDRWNQWNPDPNKPASITPSPQTKDYSIHGDSEMLTHDQVATKTLIVTVLFDVIPRQVYLHFLLRLPYLYFSRVTRIFEETELSMAEIRKQALENKGDPFGYFPGDKIGLVRTWESFIDSLVGEWQTLNIVSVLLLSAILTILQIDVAASDPFIRYSALLSMICALMSLLYGCMYIIRFGSMKKAHKAAEWAEEAQSTKTNIFWNVWVLLAMPATWLAWSIILYVTCIAAFIWRTSPGEDPGSLLISNPLWPRIVLSTILGLGLVYFILIIATLRRYGATMDQAWKMRVENWAQSGPYLEPQNGWGIGGVDSLKPPGNNRPRPERATRSPSPATSMALRAHEFGWEEYSQLQNPMSIPPFSGPLVKPEVHRIEDVDSLDPDPEAVEIYEIGYSGETRIDTVRWKHRSELDEAGVYKVYNIDSHLEESLTGEDQFNTSRGTVLTKSEAKFDNAIIKIICHTLTLLLADKSQDLTEWMVHRSDTNKPVNEADVKEILDILTTFNEEICSPSDFRLVLCNEVPVSAGRKAIYVVPKAIATTAPQDALT